MFALHYQIMQNNGKINKKRGRDNASSMEA